MEAHYNSLAMLGPDGKWHDVTNDARKVNEWITTPPTEPGWYWAHDGESRAVVYFNIHGSVTHPGLPYQVPVEHFTHWLGPLPVPEPPQ